MSPTLVCNTGPLIAIAAATGDWRIFQAIPERILIPPQVAVELAAGSPGSPGRDLLHASPWLEVHREHWPIPAFLTAALDLGEAAVISLALHLQINRVAIDEQAARHISRSCGLALTGSLGLLLRAKHHGAHVDLALAIERMRTAGIWISSVLEAEVLRLGDV